ncbi:MAG: aspartate aminotransferase family protein [Nitrososphaerota archaeon]|nr:aspartate aminotransferase family protein [Nitrososphaerota archaeon]
MKESKAERLLERLNGAFAGPSKLLYYPLIVKEAHGSTVTDVEGRDYIDFNAGWTVAGVGFSNPEVVEAVKEQVSLSAGLAGGTFPSETAIQFAEKLVSMTPGRFEKRVWFGHSGTDSCAAAYKLIPMATGRERSVTFFGGMHGVDLAGLAMGGIRSTNKYRVPSLVTKVPYAYCYRCPYGLEYPSCGVYCASDFIEEQVFKNVCPPEDTAFMLVEPMQSDSGDIVPPREYLPKLRKTTEKFGIALVADEVKIGFGRTGKMFGVENTGVVPDAVALGKSVSSGIPVGALVAKKELFPEAFAISTLVGNAVGAAAGIATIRIIERDHLSERAAKLGRRLRKRLDEMKERHPLIGDVRGQGLILGVEFVKDRKKKTPARIETAKVVYRAWQLGLLTVFVGSDANVVELTPPLVISEEDLEAGADILDRAIGEVERGGVSDAVVRDYTGM